MKKHMNLSTFTVALFSAHLSLLSASAAVYDAAADFSLASNPNGVWSYGWEASTGSAFILDTDSLNNGQVSAWRGDLAGDGNPAVYRNNSAAPVQLGTVEFPADTSLLFHPGPGGQNSVVRFTAPSTGDYIVSAEFTAQDVVAPSTKDVHVLDDNVSIFNGLIGSYGSSTGLSPDTLFLTAGDTIDFTVGTDGNAYVYDSVGLDALVTTAGVPDGASTINLLTCGIFGLGLFGRRFSGQR